MLTVAPFVSRSMRRLGFESGVQRHAVRSWEIEPASETEQFAAIFDADDLERVVGTARYTTLEFQLRRLRADTIRHPPRYAHLLRGVSMVEGHLFTMRMVHPLAHRPLPNVSAKRLPNIPSGVVGTTEYGNKYFGHWLLDDIPMSLTARDFGEVYGHVNADNRLTAHQLSYADLFDWNIHLIENAFFRELTVLDWSPMTSRQGERYRNLRSRLQLPFATDAQAGVMLLRGATGQQRVLGNESAIAEMAAARGFQIVDPMVSSVPEIIKACANARIVMGVEGSQLAHGFLPMAPGGCLLTFQPPFKFDHFWKERCDCIGARYAFQVGTQTGEAAFEVSVGRVRRMLDRLQTTVATV